MRYTSTSLIATENHTRCALDSTRDHLLAAGAAAASCGLALDRRSNALQRPLSTEYADDVREGRADGRGRQHISQRQQQCFCRRQLPFAFDGGEQRGDLVGIAGILCNTHHIATHNTRINNQLEQRQCRGSRTASVSCSSLLANELKIAAVSAAHA